MPELDTYHVIERFAKNNNDKAALQAYRFLQHRTALTVQWRALQYAGYLDYQKSRDLYTGTSERTLAPTKLEDMSEPERRDLYMKMCAGSGIQIDPSLLESMN